MQRPREWIYRLVHPCLQVTRNSKHFATLRADRRALYVQKSFPVNVFDKITCRLQATAATSYQGALTVPDIQVDLRFAWTSISCRDSSCTPPEENKAVSGFISSNG